MDVEGCAELEIFAKDEEGGAGAEELHVGGGDHEFVALKLSEFASGVEVDDVDGGFAVAEGCVAFDAVEGEIEGGGEGR